MIRLTPTRAEVLKALVSLFTSTKNPPSYVSAEQVMEQRMRGRSKFDPTVYNRTTEQALNWLADHVPALAKRINPAIGQRWRPTTPGRVWAVTMLGVKEMK